MNFKTILKSLKNKDMLKRLGIIFGIIAVYRFIAHIPVPLAQPTEMRTIISNAIGQTDLGGFLNLLSGGALTGFAIVMVGISPYITASIIFQLLTKAIPSMEELSNDGETGRRRINQWTRILSVPLAVFQSIAYIFILRQTVLAGASVTLDNLSLTRWVIAITSMVAGSVILMWFGELITEQGIGNGISTIIFIGIVSQMPNMLATVFSVLTNTSHGSLNVFNWFTLPINPAGAALLAFLIVVGLIVLYFLVKINEAQRLITINYAKRVHGNSSYGGIRSIMPLRLITAGVVPVIFAVAFLSLPAFIGQLMKSSGAENLQTIANNLILWFRTPTAAGFELGGWQAMIYPIVYFVLIVMFTYFYTSVVFNSEEISDNLQKQGGFIEGVRPGSQTTKFLKSTVNRLTLFGSLALGVIAVTPFVIDFAIYKMFGVSNINFTIGGTGALIMVTVALENLRQLSSRALMVTYDDYK
ncbi:MAG: preprotein translocase subunit SecY [Candidatus Saccharibacteria bacterium]|nr:preprotein translocase subunit SecY [Candidatus Saccharibacteria bacterium]